MTPEQKAELLRSVFTAAYNTDFDEFSSLYEGLDIVYIVEKWQLFTADFPKWFCSLDSERSTKFLEVISK